MTTALEYVKEQLIKEGYGTTDEDVWELLESWSVRYEEVTRKRRWWNDTFKVVYENVDTPLIGFASGQGTGDEGLLDRGWVFNPSSVTFVEPYEVTETRYRPKGTQNDN